MQRIRLNTATEVLASIPTMLGFIPTASVIVIMLKDEIVDGRTTKQIALVTRTDAAIGEGAEFDPAPFLEAAARAETTAAICVAVAEDSAAVIALDQIAILRQGFRDAGICDMLALHVTALEAGALWTDLDTYATGLTEDPNASTLSIHNAVEEGRSTAASREDIAARYAVTVEADTAPAHAALHAQGPDFVRHTVTELVTLIRTRGNPDAELAGRVGLCATISPTARDALLFTANGNEHAAAHAFATIARQVRGNARIQMGLEAIVRQTLLEQWLSHLMTLAAILDTWDGAEPLPRLIGSLSDLELLPEGPRAATPEALTESAEKTAQWAQTHRGKFNDDIANLLRIAPTTPPSGT